MADEPSPASRQDRLAARLRDNLHRRKAQARAQGGRAAGTPDGGSGGEGGGGVSGREGEPAG